MGSAVFGRSWNRLVISRMHESHPRSRDRDHLSMVLPTARGQSEGAGLSVCPHGVAGRGWRAERPTDFDYENAGWISLDWYDGGLLRFDGVRFTPWAEAPGAPLLQDKILSVFGARDGSLWFGTDSRLFHWGRKAPDALSRA